MRMFRIRAEMSEGRERERENGRESLLEERDDCQREGRNQNNSAFGKRT